MRRILLSALVAGVLLPALVVAQPARDAGGRRGFARMHERIFQDLKLSDEQRDQIRKLSVDHQKAQTDIQAKIRNARLDLRELFHAATLDRSAIEKQMTVVSDLEQKAKMNRLDHLFAVYKILTPEQQKLWREHIGRMWGMEGMGGRMHRPGGQGIGMIQDDPPMEGTDALAPEGPTPTVQPPETPMPDQE